jgi:hypothetical protein
MNSVWISLLWKEWREHRWILAILTALLVAIAAFYGLRRPDSVLSVLTTALVLVVPLAAALIAAGIAAREQAAGTMGFLQALPVSMTRPATAKLMVAAFSIGMPVVASVAVAAACIWLRGYGSSDLESFDRMFWPMPWGIANRFAAMTVAPSLVGISLMVWMAAASVNRSDEVRAGAVGFLAVAACWCLLIWMSEGLDFGREQWFLLLVAAAPGVAGAVTGEIDLVLAALVVLASHGLLIGWYLYRFGRIAAGSKQTAANQRTKTVRMWLAPPRRRPWRAILWKQTRESTPLAVMAAAAMLGAYFVVAWAQYEEMNQVAIDSLIMLCLVIWLLAGLLVAVVGGIGVLMDDLQPQLHAFWRSRPINVDQLFWLKFSGGLLVTIGMLALALAPLAAIIFGLRAANADLPDVFREQRQIIGIGIGVQVGAFCAAVAAMAVLRQAVLAAITALAAIIGLAVLLSSVEPALQATDVAWICVPLLATVVIIPWLAVRYDWGWKP